MDGFREESANETAFKERAPPLTRRVRKKEAPKCLGEVAVIEQCSKLIGDVAANVGRCRSDLAHDLRSPSTTAMMSSRSWLATMSPRPRLRPDPPVAEAKHVLVHGHDVEDEIVPSPPAERRAWRGVLGKSQRASPHRAELETRTSRHGLDSSTAFKSGRPVWASIRPDRSRRLSDART